MASVFLNVAATCAQTYELGPGKRFGLWVQGCSFSCKGCIAPDWIPLKKADLIAIEKLAEQIITSDTEGVSISGGEPFLQASKLSLLIELVWQQKPEITVIVFTGFSFKQLDWQEAHDFLKYIDVLKTGLYVEKKNDNKGLRGSSNQDFHFLTPRLKEHKSYFYHKKRHMEVHLQNKEALMVGMPLCI